jgi:hypothetical protein
MVLPGRVLLHARQWGRPLSHYKMTSAGISFHMNSECVIADGGPTPIWAREGCHGNNESHSIRINSWNIKIACTAGRINSNDAESRGLELIVLKNIGKVKFCE